MYTLYIYIYTYNMCVYIYIYMYTHISRLGARASRSDLCESDL